MKPKTSFIALLLLLTSHLVFAQNLNELDTVAFYSLINTAVDETGNYDDIELVNTPYQGADGIYCNGKYLYDILPGGSILRSPSISQLYDSTFAISVEFRIDVAAATNSPILICGDSWRYLGIQAQSDSTFSYNFNNYWTSIPLLKVNIGEWQKAAVIYSMTDSTATYWLDGQQVAMAKGALDRSGNDSNVSNTDGGAGTTFLGNLRNLGIYSDAGIISSTTPPWAQSKAQVYPNPTSDKLIIADAQYAFWTIYNLNGTEIAKGTYDQQQHIDVRALAAGTYILTLQNNQKTIVHRQRFQKI